MCVRRVQRRPESPCKKLHDKPTMAICTAKGFGGDRKAPEKLHDKPIMEMCTAKGFVKPDEVRDSKAPKSLLRYLNKSPKI